MKHRTPEICDLHSKEIRVFPDIFKQYGTKSSCSGKTRTVKLDEDNRSLKSLLQTPGDGNIAIVDVGTAYCAVVGDVLSSHAIENNWSGLIINGYVRDTKALSTMALPIWAIGKCPLRSEKRAEGQVDIALKIDDIEINSGDFIYADEDGILLAKSPFEDINFME